MVALLCKRGEQCVAIVDVLDNSRCRHFYLYLASLTIRSSWDGGTWRGGVVLVPSVLVMTTSYASPCDEAPRSGTLLVHLAHFAGRVAARALMLTRQTNDSQTITISN